MYAAGVRAVVEPAFWLGQPRTSVGSFVDYFDALIGWERFRAAQFGIRHHCTIALNPKEANDPRCRRGARRAAALPREGRRRRRRRGRLRLDDARGGEVFATQLELAASRAARRSCTPRTATRPPARAAPSTWCASRASRPERVVVDHLNEATVGEVADSAAGWASRSIRDTKMDEHRMVAILREYGTERMLVNSAADWGRSDPLKTRKTAEAMLDAGFTERRRRRVLWRNPVEFYGQSGRLRPRRAGAGAFCRGQLLAPRRSRATPCGPAGRRHRRATRLLHQRAPRRGPRRRARTARRLRGTRARAPGLDRLGRGPVAAGGRSPPASPRPGGPCAAARRLDARGLEVRHPQRVPVRGRSTPTS